MEVQCDIMQVKEE